jgi:16S rRNA (guanine966-N2)-methyltransferase
MIRIIGGEFRSRKIEMPSSSAARPTKDRVREAVFNMTAPRIGGARVLDLFAGSGACGFEALSRGAVSCVFVDSNPESTAVISRNIRELKVQDRSKVILADVSEYLEGLSGKTEKFDIIFSDPPYGTGLSKNILIMIERYDILGHSGLLIMEHGSKETIPEAKGDVSIYKQKSYGITSISIFTRL